MSRLVHSEFSRMLSRNWNKFQSLIVHHHKNSVKEHSCRMDLHISSTLMQPLCTKHMPGARGPHSTSYRLTWLSFHTSTRRLVPPFLLIILGSVTKVGAALSLGFFRIVYTRLNESNRMKFFEAAKKYWYLLLGGSSVISGTSYYNYCTEKTPITGRKRFMIFNKQQRADMAKTQSEMLRKHFKLNPQSIYPSTHSKHRMVQDVADKLLAANPELKHIEQFRVFVIKDPILNAHVLHDGHVFVSASILKLASNSDQIAMLLGHELAHALLDHGIEKLNHGTIVEDVIISVLGLLGYILPKGEISKYLRGRVVRMQLQRPYTHEMEEEADIIGVRFAANACYDIREGVVFWRKMAKYQKTSEPSEVNAEWTWTHPDSPERAAHIENVLEEAEQWRKEKNCPALPEADPRNKKIRLPSAEKYGWYKSSSKKDLSVGAVKDSKDTHDHSKPPTEE
nr:metalloendopeptidase OMA1; mitochondrial-like isoform X1 [Biomphalaria glabrata]